jgi:hypothetical protein
MRIKNNSHFFCFTKKVGRYLQRKFKYTTPRNCCLSYKEEWRDQAR